MQDKLTPRQSRAWGLCALSVPAAMVLAGRGWLWVLAGSAAASGIVLFLQTLQRRSGQSLLEQMARAFGQHGGQIVGAAVCLWLLLAASGAAAASQIAFEDDLGPLAPAVPLLLAALASRKGQAAAARVSGVLALCLALLYSIIALASLRHVRAAWCRPCGSAADAGLSLCLCLTPACLLFLDGPGQTPRPGWSALAAAVLPGVAALLCSACLSPAWTAQLPQPLYTLTKSLSVLSVMQRFELLLSTAQLLGLVSLLTLLVCAAARTAEVCLGAGWGEKKEGAFCLLAFGVSFLTQRLPMAVWVVGAATFWGVIPILTQVIGNIKKNEK